MKQDIPTEEGALIALIADHWAPGLGDAEAFLHGLAERQHRRQVRSDVLSAVALAAAMLLFVWSAPTATPDPSWLASTSFADPSTPALPADLALLRSAFLPSEGTP